MLPLDVTSDESIEAAVEEVMRLDSRMNLLVNNAGFMIAPASRRELDRAGPGDLRYELLRDRADDARHRAPHAAQESGRIINIGSVCGLLPMPYVALYVVTEHAIEGSRREATRVQADGHRRSAAAKAASIA